MVRKSRKRVLRLMMWTKSDSGVIKTDKSKFVSWETCLAHMQSIPQLMELVTTPILLEMVVTILPDLMQSQTKEQSVAAGDAKSKTANFMITQAIIYDYFIKRWITREKLRLMSIDHRMISPVILQHYETLVWTYAENLAHYVLYMSKFTDRMDITFSEDVTLDPQLLLSKFKQKTPELMSVTRQDITTIRSGCLLKAGTRGIFRFWHKTLIEYFAACSLFDPKGISCLFTIHKPEIRSS